MSMLLLISSLHPSQSPIPLHMSAPPGAHPSVAAAGAASPRNPRPLGEPGRGTIRLPVAPSPVRIPSPRTRIHPEPGVNSRSVQRTSDEMPSVTVPGEEPDTPSQADGRMRSHQVCPPGAASPRAGPCPVKKDRTRNQGWSQFVPNHQNHGFRISLSRASTPA